MGCEEDVSCSHESVSSLVRSMEDSNDSNVISANRVAVGDLGLSS